MIVSQNVKWFVVGLSAKGRHYMMTKKLERFRDRLSSFITTLPKELARVL